MSKRTYRHKVTGLVQELDPVTARGMGELVEEVRDDAKPLVPLATLQEPRAEKAASKKEQKDD